MGHREGGWVCLVGMDLYSAKKVVSRVLTIKLASAVETEVAADTVGVGRGARAARLGGEECGTALLAGKADVGRRT